MLTWFIHCFRLSRWFSFNFTHNDAKNSRLVPFLFGILHNIEWIRFCHVTPQRLQRWWCLTNLNRRVFYDELDVSTECLSRHERSEFVRMSTNLILFYVMRMKKKLQISFLNVFVKVGKNLKSPNCCGTSFNLDSPKHPSLVKRKPLWKNIQILLFTWLFENGR